MKRTLPFFTLLLLVGWAASSDDAAAQHTARLDFFNVVPENNAMVVTWKATTESGVERYELQRKTRFMSVPDVIVLKPEGAGTTYRYVDNELYKIASDQVDYRLEVVYLNGLREELGYESMSYTPTAVRRTWGSIKAMFQ